jgi:uncharacterized protein (DUF1778 family)
MATKGLNIEKARFDTRLPKEQKALFERAAHIAGFRSLTDFVLLTVQKRASEIIREKDQVIASQKDSEIFFDVITNSPKPNKKLTQAANEYKAFSSK